MAVCLRVQFMSCRAQVRRWSPLNAFSRSVQLLSSPGGGAELPQVMTSLFGAAASKKALLPLRQVEPDRAGLEVFGLPDSPAVLEECSRIGLAGFVSNCQPGDGRHAPDRQFVFVNQRPVDHVKVGPGRLR